MPKTREELMRLANIKSSTLKKLSSTPPTREQYFTPQSDPLQNWDYSNPPIGGGGKPLGPSGDPLPPLAKGWRPDGLPDYGTSDRFQLLKGTPLVVPNLDYFSTWFKKSMSRLMTAYQAGHDEGFLLETKDKVDQANNIIGGLLGPKNKSAELTKASELLGKAKRPASELGKDLNAALGVVAQSGMEVLNGLLELFQYGAEYTERQIGTPSLAALDIIKGEFPFVKSMEDYKKYLKEEMPEYMEEKYQKSGLLYGLASGYATENVLYDGILAGLLLAGQDVERASQIAKAQTEGILDAQSAKNAGRLLQGRMSGTAVEARWDELEKQGVRPDFIEDIIIDENKWMMWPELAGQLVLDPLNLVDAPVRAITSARRAARQSRLMKAQGQLSEAVVEVGKAMDVARTTENTTEYVKAFRGLRDMYAGELASKAGDLASLQTTKKPFVWWWSKNKRFDTFAQMTSTSKVMTLANDMDDMMQVVVKGSKNLDEQMEMFGALQKAGQGALKKMAGTAEEIKDGEALISEAVETFMHFNGDPSFLFSTAGQELAVFMGSFGDDILDILKIEKSLPKELARFSGKSIDEILKLLEAEKGKSGIIKLLTPYKGKMADEVASVFKGGDRSKLIQVLAARMNKAVDSYYPSIGKMLDNPEKYADILKDVKPWQQFVAKVEKGPIGKVPKIIQRGFAAIQLNTPGYVFRNWIQNSESILFDYGLEAFRGNPDKLFASADEFLGGGLLQKAHGFGTTAPFADTEKFFYEKTNLKTMLTELIKKHDLRKVNDVAEVRGVKYVESAVAMEEWEKGVGAIQREFAQLFPENQQLVSRLPGYLNRNKGDVDKIMANIIEDYKLGYVDSFSDSSKVPTELAEQLKGRGQWDDFVDNVLGASTKEDAEKALDDIFAKMENPTNMPDTVLPIQNSQLKVHVEKENMSAVEATIQDQKFQMGDTKVRRAGTLTDDLVMKYRDETGNALSDYDKIKRRNGIDPGGVGWGSEQYAAKNATTDMAWKFSDASKNQSVAELIDIWKKNPAYFPETLPPNMTGKVFRDALWAKWRQTISKSFMDESTRYAQAYIKTIQDLGIPDNGVIKQIEDLIAEGEKYADLGVGYGGRFVFTPQMPYGGRTSAISQLAEKYGIPTATEKGVPTDARTLSIIKKYAKVEITSLEDNIDLQVVEDAFREYAIKHGTIPAENIPQVTRMAEEAKEIQELRPITGDVPPHYSELAKADLDKLPEYRKMADKLLERFGEKEVVTDQIDLKKFEKLLRYRVNDVRAIASRVAQEARNFTLLNYGSKTYWDVILSYVFPYHFWYGRTYMNWVSRIASEPAVIAAYAKYKSNLASIHQRTPEWYKNQLNTNDLPGVRLNSPLFFNLEATLWPLNGVTGVDFNDPYKRVGWWTNMLDYSNRFGPTTFTPIQILTGIALYQRGIKEKDDQLIEAGRRWMGRIIPQSSMIKKVTAKWLGKPIEIDPMVLLQGGMDPYEEKQVSRALSAMQQEAMEGRSPYTPEQIAEAGYTKQGAIWDEAYRRAMSERAWPALSSFFLGVGFKGRTQQDLENDKFYTEYSRLMAMRDSLSTEEWRTAMANLQNRYPFMDTLLVANRVGFARDSGFAYSVLSRIPPGKTDDYAELVGVDYALLEKFWDEKGRIENWKESDRNNFMSAILDLAAVLAIPDNATKLEWAEAKNLYSSMTTDMETKFGKSISGLIDEYYALKGEDTDKANDFIDTHPEVQEALDWKAQRILGSPLMQSYYASYSVVEQFFDGLLRTEVIKQCGADFYEILSEYYRLSDVIMNDKEAKAFKKKYKARFDKYYSLSEYYNAKQNEALARLSNIIPAGSGKIRQDFDVTSASQGAQSLAEGLQETSPEQVIPIEQWESMLGSEMYRIIIDNLVNQTPFEYDIAQELEDIAKYKLRDYGLEFYDADALIQAIGKSYYK